MPELKARVPELTALEKGSSCDLALLEEARKEGCRPDSKARPGAMLRPVAGVLNTLGRILALLALIAGVGVFSLWLILYSIFTAGRRRSSPKDGSTAGGGMDRSPD